MDMQNVSNLVIPEGNVNTIHDKDNRLIWGRLAYDTKYAGNAIQNGTPTPATPVNVDVVTGTQAVTVSDGVDSEAFTISLGSIELCKIGNYQDYIYKSGGDWYVHKETGKVVLDGSSDEDWSKTNSGTVNYFYRYHYLSGMKTPADGSLSNILIRTGINSSNTNQGFDYVASGELRIRYGAQKTTTEWKSFLSTTPMLLYYPLDNSTDIQITDATLISQLDAIHEWLTRYGYDATVTGNLPIIIDRTNL